MREWAAGVVLLAAYAPFFLTLASVSRSQPYAGHVALVPLLAAGLLWAQRDRFRLLRRSGTPLGIALTGVGLAVVSLGYATADVRLQALSLIVALAGFVLWRYGGEGVRIARFALVFLLFMIPVPREIVGTWAPALQRFIAAFSAVVLETLTVPVEQQGIFLLLPGMTLEVAEECSGLRFMLILFVLVSAFARLVLATRRSQMLLVLLAVPVAVFANASRVAVTSASAYAIGPEAITGPLHYYIGKSFWGIAMIGMIALALVLRAQSTGVATATASRTKELTADAP